MRWTEQCSTHTSDLRPPRGFSSLSINSVSNQPVPSLSALHIEEGAFSCCHLVSIGVCGPCHYYYFAQRTLLSHLRALTSKLRHTILSRRSHSSPRAPSRAWRQIRRHCTAPHSTARPSSLNWTLGNQGAASCTTNSSPSSLQADLHPSPLFLPKISLNLHFQSQAFT